MQSGLGFSCIALYQHLQRRSGTSACCSYGQAAAAAQVSARGANLYFRLWAESYYTILYYTIPCYTILYYTILYYTILYYTILYYTILYHTMLYYTILYCTILYCTILYYTILYYTILYYTILYYTILYYTILCIASGWMVLGPHGVTRSGKVRFKATDLQAAAQRQLRSSSCPRYGSFCKFFEGGP